MVKAALVNEFIKKLKGLMIELVQAEPDDIYVLRLQRQLTVATDLAPLEILEKTGCSLARYHESIYSQDPEEWKKFYNPDLGASKFAGYLPAAAEDRSSAEHVIGKVQLHLRGMEAHERLVYLEKVRHLLDMYLDYHAT